MFTVFLGQDKSVQRCERRSLSIPERLRLRAWQGTTGICTVKGHYLTQTGQEGRFGTILKAPTKLCCGSSFQAPAKDSRYCEMLGHGSAMA